MKKTEKVVCLGWAIAGVHYDYIKLDDGSGLNYGNCSCRTYYHPDHFLRLFESGEYQAMEHNQKTDFSGAWVIDKEKIVEENTNLVLKAPLLDCKLPPRALSRLFQPIIVESVDENDLRSMDSVGIELYVSYWRKAGARIGKVQEDNKTIVWE